MGSDTTVTLEDQARKADVSTNRAGVRFDDFLEDIFGLNVKALQSLGVLFWKPRRYFEAALDRDWLGGRFTPSIRLWLSMIAVLFFFQFVWADEDGAIMQTLRQQMESPPMAELLEGNATVEEATEVMARYYFASYPFFTFATLIIAGLLINFWGRATTLALRLRLLFSTVLPALALALITTPLTALLPVGLMLYTGVAFLALDVVVNGVTAWRGAFAHLETGGRLWRTLLLAFLILVIEMIGLTLSQMFAGIMLAVTFL